MGKRARSTSIERFIRHVDEGLIVGEERSSGPAVLTRMRNELEAVLEGVEPDTALGVTRTTGPDPKPYTLHLALCIHNAREAGEKWSIIEIRANEWLKRHGEKPLSLGRLKTLRTSQLPEIERLLSIESFFRALRESGIPKK